MALNMTFSHLTIIVRAMLASGSEDGAEQSRMARRSIPRCCRRLVAHKVNEKGW